MSTLMLMPFGYSCVAKVRKKKRGLMVRTTSYLLPLASKTSFSAWYAKLSQAPTLICLPCCVILACSIVGNLRLDFFFYFRWIPVSQASNFCWLIVTNQVLILPKQDREPVLDHSYMLSVKILSPVSHESRWFVLNQSFFFFSHSRFRWSCAFNFFIPLCPSIRWEGQTQQKSNMVSWKEFARKLRLLLFQYEVCTSIAVMDFNEKCIIRKFARKKLITSEKLEEKKCSFIILLFVFFFPPFRYAVDSHHEHDHVFVLRLSSTVRVEIPHRLRSPRATRQRQHLEPRREPFHDRLITCEVWSLLVFFTKAFWHFLVFDHSSCAFLAHAVTNSVVNCHQLVQPFEWATIYLAVVSHDSWLSPERRILIDGNKSWNRYGCQFFFSPTPREVQYVAVLSVWTV